MLGRHATAAQLERTIRSYRRCAPCSLDDANAVRAMRHLDCRWDDDGFLSVRGRLAPEEGALVVQALEAARQTLRDAAHTPNGRSDVSAETDTHAATGADALAFIAETALAGGLRSRPGGSRTELVVHVDADSLVAGDEHADGICHIEAGTSLHPEAARRLGCDASLVRVIERDGRPLSVGRRRRTVPAALRRALTMRERGCRFPGCGRTYGLDAHHVKHWAHGGETKLSNLVQLCRRHHRLVHEEGYSVQTEAAGFTFRDRDGRVIPQVLPAPPGRESRVREANRTHAPNIDRETCMPISRGERMDHAMAVDGLLAADGAFTDAPARASPR